MPFKSGNMLIAKILLMFIFEDFKKYYLTGPVTSISRKQEITCRKIQGVFIHHLLSPPPRQRCHYSNLSIVNCPVYLKIRIKVLTRFLLLGLCSRVGYAQINIPLLTQIELISEQGNSCSLWGRSYEIAPVAAPNGLLRACVCQASRCPTPALLRLHSRPSKW